MDADRPDGKPAHRRRGRPSPATASLLTRYQQAMRDDLGALLDELAPQAPPPGLGLVQEAPKRPAIADRARLWDLAIKLGRELGAEVDGRVDPKAPAAAPPARSRRSTRVDWG